MICSKCGKEFSDEMNHCPYCFEKAKKEKKKFVVNFSDEDEFENTGSVFSFDRQQEYSKSFTEHENNTYSEKAVGYNTDEEKEEQTIFFSNTDNENIQSEFDIYSNSADSEKSPEYEEHNELLQEKDRHETPTEINNKATASVVKNKKTPDIKKPPENKKTARAFTTIKIVVAACILLTIGLTVVGVSTPIFKNSAGVDKTVALTGLSKEAVASFEDIAPGFCGFVDEGYDSSKVTFDSLVPYLLPDSDSGIIASLASKQQVTVNQPDPLERFYDGETFAYVSVDSKTVQNTAQLLGVSVVDDIDTSYCYCYDGMYYFAPSEQEGEEEKMQVKVTSSKLTQEGKYYIECALYPETAQKDEKGNFSVEPYENAYFIAECEKNGDGFDWAVNKISSTPLFDQTGAAVSEEETDGLPYEMIRKTIKATTSEGQVYAKYIIEYPSFTTDGITQTTVNALYNELVLSYRKKAKTADSMYQKYIESGADESALPLTIHIVSTVTYNEQGYLSLLKRITDNDTATTDETTTVQETTTVYQTTGYSESESEAQTEKAVLPETTYEGYTFYVESGDFVQKDEVLGKDYQAVQKLLFESYTKSGEEQMSEEETTTSPYGYVQTQNEADTDTNGIGQAIYSSPWVLLADGVGFCYQTENSGLETVVLEYNKLDTNIFD
ncbi:MAG: hypothetical protein ACI4SB_07300 [Acutalibacteraceae bacterium]